MTIRISKRASAAMGAIMAMTAATPALADATADFGPVSVTLGGFLASEGVYRSRSETADIGSSFNGVPFANQPVGHMSETRFTARQSRLSLLVQGNINADTHVAMYDEMDFLGGAQTANSNESNSYNLRIRNIYGTIDWEAEGLEVLAGQNWSLLTLNSKGITPRNEVIPATIEAQYVVGFNWARQPQLRIVKNWNHEFWAAFSIENPQTTFAPNAAVATGVSITNVHTGGSLFNNTNNFSLNHIPDLIGKFAWEPKIGGTQPIHLEVFGLYRDFYDRINVNATNALGLPAGIGNHDQSGGGFGGSIFWSAIPKMLDLQFTAMTGSGIGRYGSGQLPDVTFRPDGTLAPAQETTMMAGATWHASSSFDLYGYAGQEAQKSKYFDVGAQHLGLGNPSYSLAGCLVEGGACSPNLESENQATVGFWWKTYQGHFGQVRVGAQYSYIHLTAFGGAGGVKPTTDDSMIFTSLRYYPF